MARTRIFRRTDGSTVRVTLAEYERRSRLQRAALERRGLVVLTDARGRQRGFAPAEAAREVARRERLAERARERRSVRGPTPRPPPPTRTEIFAADVDPCDIDSVRAWLREAIPAAYDAIRAGDALLILADDDDEDPSTLALIRIGDPADRAWRTELVRAVVAAAQARCKRDPAGLAVPAEYKDREQLTIGTFDPATGATFVPAMPKDAPASIDLRLIRVR